MPLSVHPRDTTPSITDGWIVNEHRWDTQQTSEFRNVKHRFREFANSFALLTYLPHLNWRVFRKSLTIMFRGNLIEAMLVDALILAKWLTQVKQCFFLAKGGNYYHNSVGEPLVQHPAIFNRFQENGFVGYRNSDKWIIVRCASSHFPCTPPFLRWN